MFGTAITWRDTFRLNEGATTGTQLLPQIVGLQGGGFAAVWTDDTNNVDAAPGTDIVGRTYDVYGAPVDPAFQINTFAELDHETDADIAALDGGGFMVIYEQNANDGDTDIQFQEFDSLGGEMDEGNVAFGAAGADQVRNPSLAAAGLDVFDPAFYGQILVSYDHTLFGDTNMLAVRFGANNSVSAPFDAGQNSLDDDRNGDSAVIGNSRIVTVYEEEDIGGTSIEFYISDQTGDFVNQATISSFGDDPHVAGTPQGFMAVWMDNSGNVRARTYDLAGNLVGNTITVASGVADDLSSPAIVATRDGYVIAWYNATTDALMGRSYFWGGSVASSAYIIETGAGIVRPELGLMPDGRIAVTWEEAGDVWAKIIDPRGDDIDGNQHDNTITSQPGGASVRGLGGDDHIVGLGGNDFLTGGDGEDYITGGDGNDQFYDESFFDNTGTDIYFGGDGNDGMHVHSGNDVYYGQDGVDTLYFTASASGETINLNLNGVSNAAGDFTFFDFENVVGSAFDDLIIGTAVANSLIGSFGDDTMSGGGGNDTYSVSEAGDTVVELANQGYDTVNTTLLAYTLGANVERVNYVEDGNFVGTGNGLDNRFQSFSGNDRFVDVLGGADIFSGGAGTDTVDFRTSNSGATLNFITDVHGGAASGDTYSSIEKFLGSTTTSDTMTAGGTGRVIYAGYGGDDVLTGGVKNDQLLGGAGNDTLNGGADKDSLDGGTGNDTLTGGSEADVFVFVDAAFGQDTITDYQDGLDSFKVFSAVADNIGDFIIAGNGSDSVTLTLIGGGNVIAVNGAAPIAITAADFTFY